MVKRALLPELVAASVFPIPIERISTVLGTNLLKKDFLPWAEIFEKATTLLRRNISLFIVIPWKIYSELYLHDGDIKFISCVLFEQVKNFETKITKEM